MDLTTSAASKMELFTATFKTISRYKIASKNLIPDAAKGPG